MRWLLFLFVIALSSCQLELEKLELPENLIEKEKFTRVLSDMMLLEAHLQSKYENVTKYYNLIQNSANEVFKSHGVDSLSYANSMDYYAQKQEVLKEIYIEIQNNVNQKRMEVENE